MDSPAATDSAASHSAATDSAATVPGGFRRRLAYAAAALGSAALTLLLLQLLVGRRLEQAQIRQAASEVASNLSLGEVGLERFSPGALAEISGMRLVVGPRPEPGLPAAGYVGPPRLRGRARRLQRELCRRLAACPPVLPAGQGQRGVWVQMASPLEVVWLYAPLPTIRGWPPDPLLLSVSLGVGVLTAVLLFLALEVQRPLRQLEAALGGVGRRAMPQAVPERGATAVRHLTAHFNAMLERLERAERERTAMLAGIAHDLRSPLTRLRLRLGLASEAPMAASERERAEADIGAIERITRQFLLFAGAEENEPAIPVPLEGLLAEVAAVAPEGVLSVDLPPLTRRVRPTALARAIGNLLDNALSHGRPPLELVLRPLADEGFEIRLWDHGEGISQAQWERAVLPFQRLDQARGGEGHCGLGMAIADRVARAHGGGLRRLEEGEGSARRFGVAFRGRSLPGS